MRKMQWESRWNAWQDQDQLQDQDQDQDQDSGANRWEKLAKDVPNYIKRDWELAEGSTNHTANP